MCDQRDCNECEYQSECNDDECQALFGEDREDPCDCTECEPREDQFRDDVEADADVLRMVYGDDEDYREDDFGGCEE